MGLRNSLPHLRTSFRFPATLLSSLFLLSRIFFKILLKLGYHRRHDPMAAERTLKLKPGSDFTSLPKI
jgi:hypothetical protein